MRAISNIISSILPSGAEALPRFGGQALAVVRMPRARSMKLAVDPRTGTVRLTLPPRGALGPALKWTETKRGWIEAQLASVPETVAIVPGMVFCLAGEDVRLDWDPRWPRTPRLVAGELRVGGPVDRLADRMMRWLKAEAKRLLALETHEYAALAGVTIASVGVGDPVSRWGSCAANGAIRYSWRLILAPTHVRRATVAHEVAHRVHMDHSPRFHALVKQLYGADPKPARNWLRTEGAKLHAFGR